VIPRLLAPPGGALLLLASLATAPYQCAGDRDPALEVEETPGEALYRLAEELRATGDEPARRRALRAIVERYPSSRFAPIAREELEAAGERVAE
jgi:hypothetical protein